jgi:hypothetical protein
MIFPHLVLARADEKRTRASCGWALVTDDVEISINIRTRALSDRILSDVEFSFFLFYFLLKCSIKEISCVDDARHAPAVMCFPISFAFLVDGKVETISV